MIYDSLPESVREQSWNVTLPCFLQVPDLREDLGTLEGTGEDPTGEVGVDWSTRSETFIKIVNVTTKSFFSR